MAFEIPQVAYSGAIKELQLGDGPQALAVGGATSYPFHLFEGKMPNPPRIAMEVYDTLPEDWAPAALEPFQGVLDDPGAWARKPCAATRLRPAGRVSSRRVSPCASLITAGIRRTIPSPCSRAMPPPRTTWRP